MPRAEELHIRAGDATLAATLLLPDDSAAGGRHPNVLLAVSPVTAWLTNSALPCPGAGGAVWNQLLPSPSITSMGKLSAR